MRVGGNESYRPPGPFQTQIVEIKPRENQKLEAKMFELARISLTTTSILA